MAGAASVAASWERPGEAFAVNATGVLNLLEAVARQAPGAHVLCVSSAEVYAEPGDEKLPFGEELALEPITPYGASKAAMEVLCGSVRAGPRAADRHDPRLQPARPRAVAGLRRLRLRSPDRRRRAGRRRGGRAGGRQPRRRPRLHRRPRHRRALVEVSRSELTGVYNICSGRPLKLAALVEEMAKATPLPLEVGPTPRWRRPADPSVALRRSQPGCARRSAGRRSPSPARSPTCSTGGGPSWPCVGRAALNILPRDG